MKLLRKTLSVTFFCLVITQDVFADMDNLMTTQSLYDGLLVDQTRRKGIVVTDESQLLAANDSTRFIEGYAAAWSVNDKEFFYKLMVQVVTYLGNNPDRRRAKLPIVMREVLESMR